MTDDQMTIDELIDDRMYDYETYDDELTDDEMPDDEIADGEAPDDELDIDRAPLDPLANDKPPIGELTSWCNYYYQLTQQAFAQYERLKTLVENVPVYSGQQRLSEIDNIVSYYREGEEAKEKMDKTIDDLKATEKVILDMIRHIQIPPGTVLTGEIPGEAEYELWATAGDMLFTLKTEDLEPLEENPNSITIKLSGMGDDEKKGLKLLDL